MREHSPACISAKLRLLSIIWACERGAEEQRERRGSLLGGGSGGGRRGPAPPPGHARTPPGHPQPHTHPPPPPPPPHPHLVPRQPRGHGDLLQLLENQGARLVGGLVQVQLRVVQQRPRRGRQLLVVDAQPVDGPARGGGRRRRRRGLATAQVEGRRRGRGRVRRDTRGGRRGPGAEAGAALTRCTAASSAQTRSAARGAHGRWRWARRA